MADSGVRWQRRQRKHRDGPLENLWGVWGGGGEVQKKSSRKGKFNERKIHAHQLTLKNIPAMA